MPDDKPKLGMKVVGDAKDTSKGFQVPKDYPMSADIEDRRHDHDRPVDQLSYYQHVRDMRK
ncbi:Uncharacterised protein [uncultured archaeon]|nr:Uncharacterised protein [uncultured archaeon]